MSWISSHEGNAHHQNVLCAVASPHLATPTTRAAVRGQIFGQQRSAILHSSPPPSKERDPAAPNPKDRIGFSTYISDGRHVYKDTVKAIYDETNKRFGTKVAPPSYEKK